MNKLTHTNVPLELPCGHQLMGRQAKWSCPGRCLVFTASPIPGAYSFLIPFFPRLKFEHPADKLKDGEAV